MTDWIIIGLLSAILLVQVIRWLLDYWHVVQGRWLRARRWAGRLFGGE